MVLLASFAVGEIVAGDLTAYTPGGGDVLICFRKAADMVVDAGPISTYTGYGVNTSHVISDYSASQFSSSSLGFGSLNGLFWSAFTWQTDNTLYMTAPRPATALNVQGIPWVPSTSDGQNLTTLRMAKMVLGAKAEADIDTASTSSAILTEDNSVDNPNFGTGPSGGTSYRDAILGQTSTANFNTTFQGVPEQKTPSGLGAANNFTTAGKVQRSDFYKLTPGAASAVWLGYFELNTNGVMTYVAYPISTPAIQSVKRAGNQTTITYTTGIYGTYTLRANSDLISLPKLSWTPMATLAGGDNTVHTVTFTDTANTSFYTITAQ